MQTGYESFWMYQNNRHEHDPNVPKNDNQSHAVLTDSYKQVQNGGHPSVMNHCIPPQNNIARSHDQHRAPHSQYVWPSSVYSMPLKPSYASNFHPPPAFSAQTNNSGYSSPYTRPNLSDGGDLRNFNANSNASQVQNRNSNNNNNNSMHFRNNQNNSAQAGRIRVRDVFSLNKSTVPSEVPIGNSYQKEQYRHYNYNSAYATKNQNQFVNYGRTSLPPANHLPPPYFASHQLANHPGSAQQFQPSSSSIGQQYSENQHQFLTSRPVDRNLNFEASKTNTENTSLLQELLHPHSNHDPFAQINRRISSDSVLGSEIVKGLPQRNLAQVNDSVRTVNPGFGNPLDLNNRLTCENSNISSNVPLIQKQQDSNTSFTSNSSSASATASVKSPVYQHSSGQETVIKISIPHSGQSTFITLSDCGSTNKNSSLPCLLDENDKFCSEWNQKNPNHDNNVKENNATNASTSHSRQTSSSNPQTLSRVSLLSPNCHDSDSGQVKNLTVPPRKRFCQVKEPFIDLNKENFNAFLESTPLSENSSENSISRVRDSESIARETTFQEKITMSALQLKQEHLNAAVESPGHDSSVPEKKVLLEIFKREKNPIDEGETQEGSTTESIEERDPVEGCLTSAVEFTFEDSNVDVKGFGFLPEVLEPPSCAEVVSKNSTEQAKSNNPTDKRKDLLAGNKEEKQKNCLPAEVNYKSRINRNKLDMLIQFLEMDEDSVERVHKTTCSKSRKETDLNHNRRKLSKNSVVKNKNNSREMIAMKSNKNSRVETSKCSPPAPRIAKPNPDKEREGRNSPEEKLKAKDIDSCSEGHVKSNPPRVVQKEGEESSGKFEPKNVNGPAETRSESSRIETESEECLVKQNSAIQKAEDLFNKYRALQTSETVFCGKCNLFSTIDLFWINLGTGELDCLNCFKKISPKSESNTEGKTTRKEKNEKSWESTVKESSDNNFKETHKTKCSSKSDCAEGILKSVKETLKQEPADSAELPQKEIITELKGSNLREERQGKNTQDRLKGDMKSGKSKRRDDISKENCCAPKPSKEGSTSVRATSVETVKKDQTTEHSSRKNISKEHQDAGKKQETVKKNTQKEEEPAGEHTKNDKKCTESSGQIRKRSDSKDFAFCKSPEEQSKKEVRTDSTDKSVKKTKECCPTPKDNSTEPAERKSTKQEYSEKGRSQSISKESNTSHKPKESDSSEESQTKSTNSSEKYKKIDPSGLSRKRKNSDEGTIPAKVRIEEDQTKKDLKPVQHKTSTSSTLKEDIEKHKTKETDGEMQSTKNPAQKVKRSSFSKDDVEQMSGSSKEKEKALKVDANYQKIKAYEQAKQKAENSTELLRRRTKEEQAVQKHMKSVIRPVVETSEKRKNKQDDGSHFGKTYKQGSVTRENKDGKNIEEKEKNHSSRKLDTSSRLLKENQNTKVRNEKNKDRREHKKSSEERKDDKKEKATIEKDDKKKLDSNSDKKLPDRLEGKSDKMQTENRHGKVFEKMLEGYLESRTESGALTKGQGKHSAHLLSKLIKKTKKLSWSLLSEA